MSGSAQAETCALWGFRRARLSRTLLGTASWERRVFQTRRSQDAVPAQVAPWGEIRQQPPSNRTQTTEERRLRGGERYLDPLSTPSISRIYEQRPGLKQGNALAHLPRRPHARVPVFARCLRPRIDPARRTSRWQSGPRSGTRASRRAASLRQGLEEILDAVRWGPIGALQRTVRSTNATEHLDGSVRRYTRNVRRGGAERRPSRTGMGRRRVARCRAPLPGHSRQPRRAPAHPLPGPPLRDLPAAPRGRLAPSSSTCCIPWHGAPGSRVIWFRIQATRAADSIGRDLTMAEARG